MEITEALPIVRALAGGVDPDNGAGLAADSICRRPQVVRALNRALGALLQAEEREQNRPANAGRYWSRQEDAQVCAEVRRGIDFHEIAKTHNRTVPSIIARLVKLGEIKQATSSRQDDKQGSLGL
jgi:hypothetical protein